MQANSEAPPRSLRCRMIELIVSWAVDRRVVRILDSIGSSLFVGETRVCSDGLRGRARQSPFVADGDG